MRVLYWAESFWPTLGGAEIFNADLISALRERGHEFVIVTPHDHDLPEEDSYRGVPIRRFAFWGALRARDPSGVMELRRRIASLKECFAPDLVHLSGVGSSVLFHGWTADACRAPTLVTVITEMPQGNSAGRDTLLGRTLRGADWVTCVSGAVLEQLRALVPDLTSRSSVIYNGLVEPPLAPAPLPFDPPRLLCLGRLVRVKGFDVALRALTSLRTRFPGLRLIVAGDGDEREALTQLAAEIGVMDLVDFTGWVHPAAVPALLNRVTAVVMPSRREGLPLVALQAASMRRPVVAARTSGLAEVVVDGETGLLVAPEDVHGLAAAIDVVLRDPARAARMGAAARERARAIFDWGTCVDRYEALYASLAGGRRDAAVGWTVASSGRPVT